MFLGVSRGLSTKTSIGLVVKQRSQNKGGGYEAGLLKVGRKLGWGKEQDVQGEVLEQLGMRLSLQWFVL